MTMRRRLPFPASGSRGFTMIEVLVALAIIAVALAASIRAVGTMANNASDLHHRLLAGWSADNALAQLRLTHAWPEVGEQNFDCSQGNVQMVCTQRVSTTPNPGVPARADFGEHAGAPRRARANGDGGRE
ncbi:general secretion pathway protein I [Burkholderia ambifaria]